RVEVREVDVVVGVGHGDHVDARVFTRQTLGRLFGHQWWLAASAHDKRWTLDSANLGPQRVRMLFASSAPDADDVGAVAPRAIGSPAVVHLHALLQRGL